jgi:hypothetical protein
MPLSRNVVRLGQSPPFVIPKTGQYVKHYSCDNTSTFTFTNQILVAVPIPVADVFQVSALGIYVQAAVASSTIRLGIYRPNPSDSWNPGDLIIDGGTVDSSTTGGRVLTISNTTIEPPFVWLAAVALGTGVGSQRNNTGHLPTDNGSNVLSDNPACFRHNANVTGALPSLFVASPTAILGSPVLAYRRA